MNWTLEEVKLFGRASHGEQKRKYTGLPYWTHTEAVADLVATRTTDREVIASAYLHDVLEDTSKPYGAIAHRFGARVAFLVAELTDVYTSESYPEWNRAKRKSMEADRLGLISPDAKLVKRCDLEDNTKDILKNDANFAKTYLAEKLDILKKIS